MNTFSRVTSLKSRARMSFPVRWGGCPDKVEKKCIKDSSAKCMARVCAGACWGGVHAHPGTCLYALGCVTREYGRKEILNVILFSLAPAVEPKPLHVRPVLSH